jgi:hypothetical protein
VKAYSREEKMAKKDKKMKRLCKWKEEDITEKFDKFVKVVKNPTFVCKKCGRVADNKKLLHKPSEII